MEHHSKNTFTICNYYFHKATIILLVSIITLTQTQLFSPTSTMTHALIIHLPLQHSTLSSPSTNLPHVRHPLAHTWARQGPSPPKIFPYKYRALSQSTRPRSNTDTLVTQMAEEAVDAQKLRSEFYRVLSSRRCGKVPLTVEPAKPVTDPLFQEANPPSFSEAMNACPNANITNFKEKLQEENLYLITEAGEQGRLPVLILSMKEENSTQKKPAVVFLHSTNKNKEWLRPLLEAYASRGYVAIAIDSRYHGERATNITTYRDALISAWKRGNTMPFLFDTVWDLIKLADYLTQREDVDPARLGITGESLGGMHAWLAAAADTRYAVVVPIIGVQGFRWAIDNDKWQARVDSIKPVFEEARIDLNKSAIDKEVVEKVWDRIAPGLASQFDSPHTVPAIAPRPLLILNGAEDPRCPLAGLDVPKARAIKAYEDAHSVDKFKLSAEPGIGHQMTALMVIEASHWFDNFLIR
ncbi:putative hydrolase YtaP [Rosa sericea]